MRGRGKEGGREGEREGGKEGEREREREREREGERERERERAAALPGGAQGARAPPLSCRTRRHMSVFLLLALFSSQL